MIRLFLGLLLLLSASPFQVFVPVVTCEPGPKGVGITDGHSGDAALIGADWWYNWGQGPLSDPRFIPMDFTGNQNFLPAGYSGWVLWLNEPENPAQSNLSTLEAAIRYGEFRQRYPHAKLIAGNVGLWGPIWALKFQDELQARGLKRPEAWGVHGYIEPGISAEQVIAFWEWFRAMIVSPGEQLWVTEFATVYGLPDELGSLISWAAQNADRYALFANRIDEAAGWYPANWPRPPVMGLVDSAGALTDLGEYYRLIK